MKVKCEEQELTINDLQKEVNKMILQLNTTYLQNTLLLSSHKLNKSLQIVLAKETTYSL